MLALGEELSAPPRFLLVWKSPNVFGHPLNEDPGYGTRVVDIGPIYGSTALITQNLFNLKDVLTLKDTDYFGNSLTDYTKLPLMKEYTKDNIKMIMGGDINLLITLVDYKKIVLVGAPGSYANPGVNYQTGIVHGLIGGTRGGAEYENLLGTPGENNTRILSQIWTGAFVIVALLIGTSFYLYRRFSARAIKREELVT
jgi:hypothetical protein